MYQVGKENAELALSLVGYDEELKVCYHDVERHHGILCIVKFLYIAMLLVTLALGHNSITFFFYENGKFCLIYFIALHMRLELSIDLPCVCNQILLDKSVSKSWHKCYRVQWNMCMVRPLFVKVLMLQRR